MNIASVSGADSLKRELVRAGQGCILIQAQLSAMFKLDPVHLRVDTVITTDTTFQH